MKYKCFLCGIPKARKTCKKEPILYTQLRPISLPLSPHLQRPNYWTKSSRLYNFALRFLFLQTLALAASYSFYSSVTEHCKGERRKTWRKPIPSSLLFKKSIQKQVWELSKTSTKLYVHEIGFMLKIILKSMGLSWKLKGPSGQIRSARERYHWLSAKL